METEWVGEPAIHRARAQFGLRSVYYGVVLSRTITYTLSYFGRPSHDHTVLAANPLDPLGQGDLADLHHPAG